MLDLPNNRPATPRWRRTKGFPVPTFFEIYPSLEVIEIGYNCVADYQNGSIPSPILTETWRRLEKEPDVTEWVEDEWRTYALSA